jgi:hypothetical protein
MKKTILILAIGFVTGGLLAAAERVPAFAKYRLEYSGAAVTYIANSGTNTAIEVLYDGDIPFRLADVYSTAATTKVYRVWQYHLDTDKIVVETNLFGTVETNSYGQADTVSTITNEIYSSVSDTLPGSEHFISGDLMLIDFGTETNVITRILGTVQ